MANKVTRISAFGFEAGHVVASKYAIVSRLGGGWEGEVYLVREVATGIERTAKFFFPQRNVRDQTARFYAKKLHKLRHCPVVIPYHTQDTIQYGGIGVTFLVSDFVDGDLLTDFLARQPGRRLTPFPAIHLLHALATGLECIHVSGEYHGDLHSDNIMINRYGLGFDLKLIDLFHWAGSKKASMRDDVVEAIRIFYEALGGARHYARQPAEVKAICCGLKRSLILKKFKTTTHLRQHLETQRWESPTR